MYCCKGHWSCWLGLVLAIIMGVYGYLYVTDPATSALFADNYFAAGLFSQGIFSVGNFSVGFFSAGVFSVGVFSIGLFSVGIFSIGIFNIGLYAMGLFLWAKYTKYPEPMEKCLACLGLACEKTVKTTTKTK
jgi:hypothetical protein